MAGDPASEFGDKARFAPASSRTLAIAFLLKVFI
jgi:hypothetical protein